MSAQLKIFTDNAHSSEVAHTTDHSTTLASGVTAGGTSVPGTSTTGMPSIGWIDIVDGANSETIAYSSISGTTINLMSALAHNHSSGVTINQWVYVLPVGDQTNGLANDGTNAAPNSPTNVATFYVYNSGDQSAQSVSIAVSNTSPTTPSGNTDTLVSITSSSAGFATSVTPSNIAAGSQQQIWVVEEVPSGQSSVNNPQLCNINISYQTV